MLVTNGVGAVEWVVHDRPRKTITVDYHAEFVSADILHLDALRPSD